MTFIFCWGFHIVISMYGGYICYVWLGVCNIYIYMTGDMVCHV